MVDSNAAVDSYGLKELGWDKVPVDIIDKSVIDLMSLKGKKAVITGAGGVGLGIALSHRLAALGADIVMSDISPKVEENAKAVAQRWGVKTYPIICDLMKYDQVEKLFAEANEKLGRIDILINNAFYMQPGNFPEFTEEIITKTVYGSLMSVIFCSRCVCDYMIPQKSGRIINISSASGSMGKGASNIALYAASKSGVNGLTRALAAELAPKGIIVNAVSPGLMFHSALREAFENPTPENLVGRIPMVEGARNSMPARPSLPEEVANTVAFLCTDACSYIYGQVINNDGGIVV